MRFAAGAGGGGVKIDSDGAVGGCCSAGGGAAGTMSRPIIVWRMLVRPVELAASPQVKIDVSIATILEIPSMSGLILDEIKFGEGVSG